MAMTNLHYKKTKLKQYNDKNSANFAKYTINSGRILLFNKPLDVLSQFTDQRGRPTLKNCIPITNVYTAGRLDRDNEGLLILTNDGKLQVKLTQPNNKTKKIY